ncbi:GlsB/YeaQ/YmgE family stress response membrane protein [Lutimonas zeaxanthinifaciens]|uniref:GlsB/YeaQ/YmgE family stress response membrane protein n=1 Tax=Lutimonas zeaxanthinifaciens TaxID=3060215 RepID=UPI001EA7D5B4|nr:GlsB/YeaQ/YmgE family stress response membrane protein [Lutimonas sp. YSD2104]UCE92716.1 MAG: GlsB/YeaQ/YmgE family stress response membrane protein [Flavobacteriaceae bacterium]WKK65875.1 GlsB/YeaQ/YmgE family stress response membrane protein [Lutimonas sp. YSD2104]
MSFLYFIIIGAIAGWLAGKIMQGGGFGLLMNMVLGIIGGVVGGWLFSFLGFSADGGILGSLVTAVVGAVLILYVGRLIKK